MSQTDADVWVVVTGTADLAIPVNSWSMHITTDRRIAVHSLGRAREVLRRAIEVDGHKIPPGALDSSSQATTLAFVDEWAQQSRIYSFSRDTGEHTCCVRGSGRDEVVCEAGRPGCALIDCTVCE